MQPYKVSLAYWLERRETASLALSTKSTFQHIKSKCFGQETVIAGLFLDINCKNQIQLRLLEVTNLLATTDSPLDEDLSL